MRLFQFWNKLQAQQSTTPVLYSIKPSHNIELRNDTPLKTGSQLRCMWQDNDCELIDIKMYSNNIL